MGRKNNNEFDIQPLFGAKIYMQVIINILQTTTTISNNDQLKKNIIVANLSLYMRIIDRPDLIRHLISIDKYLFLTIPFTAAEISGFFLEKGWKHPNDVQQGLHAFLTNMFPMVYTIFDDNIYPYLHEFFDRFMDGHSIAAFIIVSCINSIITLKVKEGRSW